ncbi:MAG: 5'/3'-nucleotidase SurE [Candidatus Hermodarchaeia archaeon]
MTSQPHIFYTNDDSARSPALRHFIKELFPHYRLTVVVPDRPRSGISKAISFNEPIRFTKGPTVEKQSIIETSGTPGDAVTWCRTYSPDVDMVISGPNLGLNVSIHSILTSGTVGAIIEAALWNIPAIAFSIDTPSNTWFIPQDSGANYQEAARHGRVIINHVLSQGLPAGIDFLNVSFPAQVNERTPIAIAKPMRVRFDNQLKPRTDPHGMEYHWIHGEEKPQPAKTSDVHLSVNEKKIVISPICIALSDDKLIEATKHFLQPLMRK